MTGIRGITPLQHRVAALPQEHGAWVFLFSPLLVGLFIGGRWTPALPFLLLSALAVFLMRQPLTLLVKIYSGRRSRRDLQAARLWIGVYLVLTLVGLAGLFAHGLGWLLWLAAPGAPVFAWHLWLVSRREERRQMGVEIVASGVLALSAPAAFWTARGAPEPLGWWLWLLTWLQSAASIVYAYLRLEQRGWDAVPALADRLRVGWRAMLYALTNVLFTGVLGGLGWVPSWVWVAYVIQTIETVLGTLRPAVKARPAQIGFRQLVVSLLFTAVFILAWLAG